MFYSLSVLSQACSLHKMKGMNEGRKEGREENRKEGRKVILIDEVDK